MVTIKELINSPLLLALVIGGLGYITLFAVVYLLKARKRALELGITKQEIGDIIKSSLIFSIVPSLSIVIGLVALAASIAPIFELPAVQTMSSYLLPALFGSMTLGLFASTSAGTKVVKGGMKGVIPVIVLVSLLTLGARLIGMGSIMLGMVGFVILVMLPIAIITSRILWKKGKIQVVDTTAPAEEKDE